MPVLNNTRKVIYLNAGHYNFDTGSVVKGIIERDEVKKIRDLTSKYLKEAGFEVVEVPDDLDLRRSIDFVNERAWSRPWSLPNRTSRASSKSPK